MDSICFGLLQKTQDLITSVGIEDQQLRTIRPTVFEENLLKPLLPKSMSSRPFSGMSRQYGEDYQLLKKTLVFPFTITMRGIRAPRALIEARTEMLSRELEMRPGRERDHFLAQADTG